MLTARADDRIWWARTEADLVDKRGRRIPEPAHVCPMAVLTSPTVREALDPMALGVCRYCKEPLP